MAYTNRNITRRGGVGRPGTALRQAGGGRPRFFKSKKVAPKKIEPYSGPNSAHISNPDGPGGQPHPDWVDPDKRPVLDSASGEWRLPTSSKETKKKTQAKTRRQRRLMRGGFNRR